MNTAKKSNLLFLIVVICSVTASLFLSLLAAYNVDTGILSNILISQFIIFLPGGIFYLIYNKNSSFKIFGRIKITSALLFIVFAELIIPLTSAVNVFSQFFTTNEVIEISDQIVDLPFIVMLLIIGILGPICEEFVFRGVIFRGLLNYSHRTMASIMLSALFFGLMHMNLNQAMYAFVLGAIFAAADYALDSLWPSVICHCVVNSQNVALMYGLDNVMDFAGVDMPDIGILGGHSGRILLMALFLGTAFIAFFATILAGLLLYLICSSERCIDRLKSIMSRTAYPGQILYATGVAAIVFCIFVIFILEPLSEIIKLIISLL